MFLQALKIAARNQIRSLILQPGTAIPNLDGASCQLCLPDGRPPETAGLVFIGVHNSRMVNTAPGGAHYLQCVVGFDVTISWRAGFVPQDRVGDHLDQIDQGLDTHADMVVQALTLNNSFTLLTAANVLITGNAEFLVGEGLRFQSMADIKEQKDRWWGGRDGDSPAGWSRTLKFGDAVCLRGTADSDL